MSSAEEQMAAAMATMTPTKQGEYLQALAYSTPPITPKGLSAAVTDVMVVLIVLSTVLTALRVYVRLFMAHRGRAFSWEDLWGILSWILFTASAIFAIKACTYGLGFRDPDLTTFLQIRCAEYMLYCVCLYGFSMPLVKASVMCQVLVFARQRSHRWAMYLMLVTATVMAGVAVMASLIYCAPVRAYWNPLLGTCGNFSLIVNIGYAWTIIAIVSDVTFVLVPYLVIKDLQMSRKNKVTVMAVLGVGCVASVAAIVRAPYLQYYVVTVDRLYWNGHLILWSLIECGIGIIAATLPAMRALFKAYLDSSQSDSVAHATGYSANSALRTIGGTGAAGPATNTTRLATLNRDGKNWEQLSDDGRAGDRFYLALYLELIPLPPVVQTAIVPVLPFWVLVSFGALLLFRLGWGVLTFNDTKAAHAELMGEIDLARAELRRMGVTVD